MSKNKKLVKINKMNILEFKKNIMLNIPNSYFLELYNYLSDFNLLNTNKQKKIIKKINKNKLKPMAYHIGYKFFYNSWFKVNKNVLIPRNETELLIQETLKYDLNNKVIADVCCGSGCIGISIAKNFKNCKVILSDISKKAIKVCIENSRNINNIRVIKCDFLNKFIKENIKVDYLILNPPYISKKDLNIEKNVKKYEPKRALYAKYNGYEFYIRLKNDFKKILTENGKCIVEFGFNMYDKLKEIFENYNVKFFKDYQGNWRYFVLYK